MAKMIRFDNLARLTLKKGVDQVADAVRVTLGPRGRNVLLDRRNGSPVVTNDGVTIARDIELEDPYENVGAQLLREVASKTQEVAGDGTTTATLLAQAIVSQGLLQVASGQNPMHLKRGIDRAVAAVVKEIQRQSRPVRNREAMGRVASLAANGDRMIGDLVSEALDRVGPEGVVTVEPGRGVESRLQMTDGIRFDRGYISPYLINHPESMEVILEEPRVLLHDRKIGDLESLVPLLQESAESGEALLIIAEDIEGEALATLVMNRLRGTLKIGAVKAPGFGDQRREMLEDLAVVTGGEVVAGAAGLALERTRLADLGRARKAVIDRDRTTLLEGGGARTEIQARCRRIRREIGRSASSYDRDRLRERLARLQGAIAVIEVGAPTELELRERQGRVQDSLAATRAAVEEGIVPGGGVALLRATGPLRRLRGRSEGESTGIRIVLRALEAPARTLAENAGFEGAALVEKVLALKGARGFNVETGRIENLVSAGVVDAAKVTRSALQNAASIGSLILTTETLVVEVPGQPPAGESAE
jgi:chaperonin GroEL